MKITTEMEIDVPSVPNFFKSKDGHQVVSIRNFTKVQLEEIGKLWTKELIKKAKKKLPPITSESLDVK